VQFLNSSYWLEESLVCEEGGGGGVQETQGTGAGENGTGPSVAVDCLVKYVVF
jgi:hypothetical protein